jgi:intracellular sulfur oxidation DsrE/DsrF family protein
MLKYTAKWSALLVSVALIAGGSQIAVAADKPFAEKKIVLQISDPNPFKQTLVLNVASNLIKEYGTDNVDIEIVAFGPGLRLLFADNANSGRIQGLAASDVKFYACSNTVNNMGKMLGHAPELNKTATSAGPGVVRIVQLVTENGYTLVKP